MTEINGSTGFHITVSNKVASSETAVARKALKDVCGIKDPEPGLIQTTVAKLWGINKDHLKKVGAYRTPKKLADADHRPFSSWRSTKQIFVNRSICPPPEPKVTFVPYPRTTIVEQKPCPPCPSCPKVEKKPVEKPIKKPIKGKVKQHTKGTKKLEFKAP